MWPDNETERDFLNFTGIADTVAEIIVQGKPTQEDVSSMEATASGIGTAAANLLKPRPDASPPKEIHAIRACFEEALSEMGIKLVVLIDDLDRCLPPMRR